MLRFIDVNCNCFQCNEEHNNLTNFHPLGITLLISKWPNTNVARNLEKYRHNSRMVDKTTYMNEYDRWHFGHLYIFSVESIY